MKYIRYRSRLESHRKLDLLMAVAVHNGMSRPDAAQFIVDNNDTAKWSIVEMITRHPEEMEIYRFPDEEINEILDLIGYRVGNRGTIAEQLHKRADFHWHLPIMPNHNPKPEDQAMNVTWAIVGMMFILPILWLMITNI